MPVLAHHNKQIPRREEIMKPDATALPGTNEKIEHGKDAAMMPKTPANGFTIIAKMKPSSLL
jgi:hypothetical protein